MKAKLNSFIGSYLCIIFLSGCTAVTTIDEYRPTNESIRLDKTEKVVILGRRDAGHYETDSEFIDCVSTVSYTHLRAHETP